MSSSSCHLLSNIDRACSSRSHRSWAKYIRSMSDTGEAMESETYNWVPASYVAVELNADTKPFSWSMPIKSGLEWPASLAICWSSWTIAWTFLTPIVIVIWVSVRCSQDSREFRWRSKMECWIIVWDFGKKLTKWRPGFKNSFHRYDAQRLICDSCITVEEEFKQSSTHFERFVSSGWHSFRAILRLKGRDKGHEHKPNKIVSDENFDVFTNFMPMESKDKVLRSMSVSALHQSIMIVRAIIIDETDLANLALQLIREGWHDCSVCNSADG